MQKHHGAIKKKSWFASLSLRSVELKCLGKWDKWCQIGLKIHHCPKFCVVLFGWFCFFLLSLCPWAHFAREWSVCQAYTAHSPWYLLFLEEGVVCLWFLFCWGVETYSKYASCPWCPVSWAAVLCHRAFGYTAAQPASSSCSLAATPGESFCSLTWKR